VGTLYVDTGGASTNSGSTDQNSANLSGTAATVSASVVTLDGSPNLSTLVTSGATQSAIYLAQASNSNKKIFWITAFDNSAKTVTVDTAPTGVTSSSWAIGGRQTVVDTALSVCRAGDTCMVNNSPASVAGTVATFRANGTAAAGPVKLIGKSGVRPVLRTTTTANCVEFGTTVRGWIENFEIQQAGATGSGINIGSVSNAFHTIANVNITDAGSGGGITTGDSTTYMVVQDTHVSGSAGAGYKGGNTLPALFYGCKFYNNAHGIQGRTNTISMLAKCIISGNSGRGIVKDSASSSFLLMVIDCTIWKNLDGGIEDANNTNNQIFIRNSIIADNGTAAGEYNIEWVNQSAQLCSPGRSMGNCIAQSGGSAGNTSLYTLDTTDITSAPSLTDPDNATESSQNFAPASGSPCRAASVPGLFLGSGTTSYQDIGAVQHRDAGGMLVHPGMSGGMRG